MKQLLFMSVLVLIGTVGSVTVTPFCGVAVYHFFAVLRPQYIWRWSLPPGVSWSHYVALAAIIGTVLQAGGVLRRPARAGGLSPPRRFYPPHVWFTVFFCWIGVSFAMAQHHDIAFLEGRTLADVMQDYAKYFVMFWVAALVARTTRQVWALYLLTAFPIGYIAYEVNFLYIFWGYLGVPKEGYGGYDNNGAGLFFAMGVPLCFFAWEGARRWWGWLFLALVPCLIHAVLVTYSRGAMLSLLVASPLFFVFSRRKRLFAVAGLAMALMVPFMAGKEIRARFSSISEHEQDGSANGRKQAWKAAWKIANDYPIFGVGVRNTGLLLPQYGGGEEGRAVHNQYMQVAADNGFVGLAFYLALIFTSWRVLRQVRPRLAGRNDLESSRVGAMAAGLQGALAVFCVGAIFLSLETFEVQYLLFLLAGQLAAVVPAREDCPGASPVVGDAGADPADTWGHTTPEPHHANC
jgi:probable O-glycosylation ligase (exosortase A-associated)